MGLLRLIPGRLGRMVPLLPPPVKVGAAAAAVPAGRGAEAGPRGVLRRLRGRRDVPPRPIGPRCACLQQNGCDVFVPPEQGCCGAIHFHAGDSRGARRMADANLVAFELDRYDAIVVNHAGCGAMMKEYGLHWRDGLQPHREKFAAKVKDVNEFLDALGMIPPTGPDRRRGHLPRRLPPGPRPGGSRPPRGGCLARFPGLRAARTAGVGHLLRLGRRLQPERGRDVGPAWPGGKSITSSAPAPRSCWPATPAACCRSSARSASTTCRYW